MISHYIITVSHITIEIDIHDRFSFDGTISIHSPLATLDPKGTYTTHVCPIKTHKIRVRVILYANAMHVINNFEIIYKQFQNHFVEPPKPRL